MLHATNTRQLKTYYNVSMDKLFQSHKEVKDELRVFHQNAMAARVAGTGDKARSPEV